MNRSRTIQLISLATFLIVWQVIGSSMNPILFATPLAVAGAAVEITLNGDLPGALLHSVRLLAVGFLISVVFGVLIGLLMGRVRFFERLLTPYVYALYASPMIALIPILMIWFGSGDRAKIAAVVLNGIFVIIVNTTQGVKNTDRLLIDAAYSFGVNESQMFTKVVLPAALPFIMTGARLGAGKAVVGLIAAELFLVLSGLGGLLQTYGASFHTARLFAVIAAIAAVGAGLIHLMKWMEYRVTPWRKTLPE